MQGATVLDFAYHVHTDIGNHMIGAKVNGKYVMASHQLANAEIVDILTYDGPLTRNLVARHQVCYEMLWSSVQITVALPLPLAFPLPCALCSTLPSPLPFPPPFPPPPPPYGGPFMYGSSIRRSFVCHKLYQSRR